ncbi:hypothetical protein CYMTET_32943 [Cymbomonas tetramitiformis]|uniref:Uncharacterized protein n=1 Tax=Cymbomonas tetramitiformis TaxID=36881 RepID=A0AAE0FE28_9CHLO|nr:hypothetical protein CYMTET_32943 [Cymbomonas tetramitiformis]
MRPGGKHKMSGKDVRFGGAQTKEQPSKKSAAAVPRKPGATVKKPKSSGPSEQGIRTNVSALTTANITGSAVSDAEQRVVFLGPLGSEAANALLRHFGDCAPLSIHFLEDVAAAAVELSSPAAVKLALQKTDFSLDGQKITVGTRCSSASDAAEALVEGLPSSQVSPRHMRFSTHTMELLACAGREGATVAIREYVRTASSSDGPVKNPDTLLRKILQRERENRALLCTGTSLRWLGTVDGQPLPASKRAALLALLEALDWKALGNVRNPTGKGSIKVENSFSLGMATNKLEAKGPFSTPFAFRPHMGMWNGLSVKKRHKEVWDAAIALLRSVDPEYHCTSIGFNKNFRGSPHRDDKDAGPQVATALGDYSGGCLRVYSQEGIIDVNTRDRWCRFDGRYKHEVLPFSGTRYRCIAHR